MAVHYSIAAACRTHRSHRHRYKAPTRPRYVMPLFKVQSEGLAPLRHWARSCDGSISRLGWYGSHRSGRARNRRRRDIHPRPGSCSTTHWLLIRSRCYRGGFPSIQPALFLGECCIFPSFNVAAPVPSMLGAPCASWPLAALTNPSRWPSFQCKLPLQSPSYCE